MRKPVSHYLNHPGMKNIKEPVALYFSYVDAYKYDYYDLDHEEYSRLKSSCKYDLVKYLRKAGYPAVPDDDPDAALPNRVVVSDSGIQTPFIEPKRVKYIASVLIQHILNSGIALPRSYVFAVSLEQLTQPATDPESQERLFGHLLHPEAGKRQEIEYRYGKNFVERQVREAYRESEDAKDRLKKGYDINNPAEPLYSGRGVGVDPFYIYARNDMESRYIVYATPDYGYAVEYCGYQKGKQDYGFIHKYEKSEEQTYYHNFGMESAGVASGEGDREAETLVTPWNNKYRGIELYFGDRYYQVPREEDKWQTFLEYHRASYINPNPYKLENRRNVLLEARLNDGKAVCYDVIGDILQELELNKSKQNLQQSIENMTERVKELKREDSKETKQEQYQIKQEKAHGKIQEL